MRNPRKNHRQTDRLQDSVQYSLRRTDYSREPTSDCEAVRLLVSIPTMLTPPIAKSTLLKPAQYRRFAELVYHLTRINLGTEKQELVAARVSKRLRHLKLSRYEDYEALITGPNRRTEIPHLIDVISTHHTYFYREQSHFEFVREQFASTANAAEPNRNLRFWSAACSTGEEPVTLAISLADAGLSPEHFEIFATDIAPNTINTARRGVFRKASLEKLPPAWRKRYFQQGINEWHEHCRLIPKLRERIHYDVLNLAESYRWPRPFDVIFIRNVMIYFDRTTQFEVLTQALRFLRPDGYVITGQSESLAGIQLPLTSVRNSIYQYKP